jgi:hypothetical protein
MAKPIEIATTAPRLVVPETLPEPPVACMVAIPTDTVAVVPVPKFKVLAGPILAPLYWMSNVVVPADPV